MPETEVTQICSRVGDLVEYLYGESNNTQASSFQDHLTECSSCRVELAAFSGVRDGMVAWRDEALKRMTTTTDTVTSRNVVKTRSRRSAVGAIREFFTLSPVWLRGATAVGSVLFVTLLIVTAFRFFQSPTPYVAKETPAVPVKSADIANRNISSDNTIAKPTPVDVRPEETVSTSARRGYTGNKKIVTRSKSNRVSTEPLLSNEELTTLLVAENEDEDSVPRLSDLLYESN